MGQGMLQVERMRYITYCLYFDPSPPELDLINVNLFYLSVKRMQSADHVGFTKAL